LVAKQENGFYSSEFSVKVLAHYVYAYDWFVLPSPSVIGQIVKLKVWFLRFRFPLSTGDDLQECNLIISRTFLSRNTRAILTGFLASFCGKLTFSPSRSDKGSTCNWKVFRVLTFGDGSKDNGSGSISWMGSDLWAILKIFHSTHVSHTEPK
jgi:hypothetical protein